METNTNSSDYQNYCPINIPLHRSYYSQVAREYRTEKDELSSSLLKDVLLHGKKTVRQNYSHSYTNAEMISSHQITPNSQIVSHNPYQISPVENRASPSEISPTECEQFFRNLQRQQEYNGYGQNYSEHTVQSHNYALFTPGPSTISMQYEQIESKQQAIFNVQQELHMNNYNRNNNNIRQRNKNIETSNHNKRDSYSINNIANYPWMCKRTNG